MISMSADVEDEMSESLVCLLALPVAVVVVSCLSSGLIESRRVDDLATSEEDDVDAFNVDAEDDDDDEGKPNVSGSSLVDAAAAATAAVIATDEDEDDDDELLVDFWVCW